jgi:hypothetical protein
MMLLMLYASDVAEAPAADAATATASLHAKPDGFTDEGN